MGTFVDRSDPKRGERRIADVRTLTENPKTGKHEQEWDHKLDAEHRDSKLKKPYSHHSGKIATLGPKALMKKLPEKTQVKLDEKRWVVIAKKGFWVDGRGEVHKTTYHGPE